MNYLPDPPDERVLEALANDLDKKRRGAHKNARTRGKVWERQAAADLATNRTGPTGMDDSDIIHDTLGVECKALAKLMLRSDHWEQAVRNAKGRIPVLALKEFGTGRKLAVIEWSYFVSLHTDTEENNGA